jgi:hypothetical protein
MSDLTEDFWGDPISTYTRAEAIADGVLVDLGMFEAGGVTMARRLGIVYPVAITGTAFTCACAGLAAGSPDLFQRVASLLALLKTAIRESPDGDRVDFKVPGVDERGDINMIDLYAICGPGDTLAPVITIMLPHED